MAGDALLVPVGHDLGVLYPEAGSDERRQQVRAGVDVVELDDRDFAVWLLAHGVSDDGRPTRSTVLATAELVGLERQQVEAAVDRLLADGLLVDVEPQELSAVGFAEQHQLFPLVIGLGPDSENAMLQTIGLLDQPLAQVSNALYDVWMWAQLAPNLWTGCHDAAISPAARGAGPRSAGASAGAHRDARHRARAPRHPDGVLRPAHRQVTA